MGGTRGQEGEIWWGGERGGGGKKGFVRGG